ncbi:MAG: hypothetical protein WCK42_02275 [Myxococcaceae bacterium]
MKYFFSFLSLWVVLFFMSCAENVEYAGQGEEKFLVISSKRGHGLGNRLRALASGYALAKQTGRTFVIDWQASSDEVPVSFNDLFKNEISTPEKQTLHLNRARKINVNSLGRDGLVEISVDKDDAARVIQIESYFRFINEGLSFDDIQKDYVDFLKKLSPVAEIENTVEKFSESLSDVSIENRIGVHFRSFTLPSDSNFKAKNPLEVRRTTMLNVMEEQSRQGQQTYFFVATDDPEMLLLMKQKFGSKIISREKTVDRSTLGGMQDALADWYLLARTNRVIGTIDSSFSDEAAFLTTTGQKIGVGPGFFHD